MTRRFNFLCALSLVFLFASTAFAQQVGFADEVVKDKENNAKWREGKNKYPSKPKDMWELGIHGGLFNYQGDVNIQPGWGVGAHLRKSLGYTFAMRVQYLYGNAKGLNYLPSWVGVNKNSVLGNRGLGYGSQQGRRYFYNFKSTYHEAALQGILTLNNLKFHKERNKWDWFFIFGAGANMYQTHHDALNANGGLYDMNNINQWQSDDKDGRKATKDALKEMLDGDYETRGEEWGYLVNIGGESWKLNPIATFGMGLGYHLGKRVTLTLEHQATFNDDDLLDGYRWAEQGDFTRDVDVPQYTSLRLNLHLGSFKKRVEPLWWLNPLDAPYEQIARNTQKTDPATLMADADDDGVPDWLDKEPNSPADCPVDTRGITLDSDGDGLPDCEDKEPYSPPCGPIDAEGVAQCPQPDQLTMEEVLAETEKRYCKDCGGTVVQPAPARTDWFLPMIHFDLDKYCIKPEFHPQLHHVATVMQKYPGLCVVVEGHADNRNPNDYNQVLSYNRAVEAADYLVNTYGIDRNRLTVRYGGEEDPLIKGLADNHSSRESSHYMNRRVEFSVGDCSGSSGRPAGPEAGTCRGKKAVSTGGFSTGSTIKR